ncbi:MAG: hypothetical protein CMJ78_14550 [Planctomycetaceae bacterium]|nr:hypothetical protein [Planctomycetaceae bacterium]
MAPKASGKKKAPPELKIPKKLGKYDVVKKLGQGGMGAVLLAKDTQLNRTVALKVLPREKAENPTLVKRFKSEAKAAAQLKHENIVAVYEAGEASGLLFIALEYIEGRDISELMRKQGPIPPKRSIDIIKQTAAALEHAHGQGIVHCDIKPSNLMIQRDGKVKLTDMGLARSIDEAAKTDITKTGTTVGTVDYMAPEQARSSKLADGRSDIYSLGCTWYHMLTGQPPFNDGSLMNKLNAHASTPPPDPRLINESVPESLSPIIQQMMAKDPQHRHQTCGELLEDLQNSTIRRNAVSTDDLSALADADQYEGDEYEYEYEYEDESSEETSKKKKKRRRRQRGSSGAAAETRSRKSSKTSGNLPPIGDRPDRTIDDVEGQGPKSSTDRYKVLGIGAAIVVGVAILGWIGQQFGSALGGSNSTPVDNTLFNAMQERQNAVNGNGGDASQQGNQNGTDTEVGIDTGVTSSERVAASDGDVTGPKLTLPTLNIGREGERQHLPAWVTSQDESPALPLLTVTRRPTLPTQFSTLDAALSEITNEGAVIQLTGQGPFYLPATEIKDRSSVVIRGDADNRPLILLVPSGIADDSLLKFSNTSLTLHNVDLHVLANHFPTSRPVNVVDVRGGDSALIGTSITVGGERLGRMTAVSVQGAISVAGEEVSAIDGQPATTRDTRLLLDRVMVRGQNCQAVHIDKNHVDALIYSSCLVTGSAPLIELTSKVQWGAAKGKADRHVRFLSSTGISKSASVVLDAAANSEDPPETNITLVNSIIAASDQASTMLSILSWPTNPFQDEGESRLKQLVWQSSGTSYNGWERLIEVEGNSSLNARDAGAWQRVWNHDVDQTQFDSERWPRGPIESFDKVNMNVLSASAVEINIRAVDGGRPGPFFDSLPVVNTESLALAVAFADRPAMQTSVIPKATAEHATPEIRIDLDEGADLARVINQDNWDDGTVFVVVGSGAEPIDPIFITDKSAKIEFRQSNNQMLLFTPQPVQNRSAEDTAIFNVDGGSLELVNVQVNFPTTMRQPLPTRFLNVNDGSFILNNCRITGPTLDQTEFDGIIKWTSSQPNRNVAEFGAIVDSYLVGPGQLVSARLRSRQLHVHNSLLVSFNSLFDIDVLGFDPKVDAAIDLQRSTLSAAENFFEVRSTRISKAATVPLTFFAEQCVFAPPVGDSKTKLIVRESSAAQFGLLQWRGNANGFVSDIGQYVATKTDQDAQQFGPVWEQAWGAENSFRVLTGDAVRMSGQLPRRGAVKTDSFLLAGNCQAARWGKGGHPIGFDQEVWPEMKVAEVVNTAKPAAPTQVKPAVPPKKNTGLRPVIGF